MGNRSSNSNTSGRAKEIDPADQHRRPSASDSLSKVSVANSVKEKDLCSEQCDTSVPKVIESQKEVNKADSCSEQCDTSVPKVIESQKEVNKEDWDNESEDESCSDTPQDDTPPVSYNLKLICSTDDTKSRNTKIVIPHSPRTVLDVKLCVENEFSIPACCQCMTFESHKLRDQDSIKELRIREGDTLIVNYTSEAMVEDIKEIIQAIKEMRRFLRMKETRQQLEKGCKNEEFSGDINGIIVETLVTMYFHPSANERNKANLLFFATNNGLLRIHQLFNELLKHPWKKCPVKMVHLEYAILRVLWHTTTSLPIRALFFQQPIIEAVMESLVRVEIPADSEIKSPGNSSNQFQFRRLVSEALFQAVGTIGNLAEIPECRVVIAARRDVLDQLLATLTCPSYGYVASLVAAAGLLCISYSPETHPYLITDNVVEKFEKACNSSKRHSFSDEQQLKYLQSLFYAQLLYYSASKISFHLKRKMYASIKNILETTTYLQIHNQEKKYGYFWSTIIPILKLAYFPKHSPQWSFCTSESADQDRKFLQELEELCIEIGVFSLQNMLLSEKSRQVLASESLVEYIVCLPWHLSPETEAHRRACDLRGFMSHKIQLHPPSLVNLTKAKLAASHCGLERVLKATSLHDIVDNVS